MIDLTPILNKSGNIKSHYTKREMFEKHNLIRLYDQINELTSSLTHPSINLAAKVNFIKNNILFSDIQCPCGKCPQWLKANARFAEYCSKECRYKYRDNMTNNHFCTKEGQEVVRAARFKKHGSQQNILNRSRKTMVEKYGVDNPSSLDFVKKKKRDKQLEPGAVEQMTSRMKQTMLKRYGVVSSMHDPDIIEKYMSKRYKSKQYIFQSGEILSLYGYEHFALSIMEKLYHVTFDELITTNRKCIKYYDPESNKHRKYLPDFIFKNKNLIEVKSEYTVRCDIPKNIAKWNASVDQGYNLEIWIMGSKGDLIGCIPWNSSQSELYLLQEFHSLIPHSKLLQENHPSYHSCQKQ